MSSKSIKDCIVERCRLLEERILHQMESRISLQHFPTVATNCLEDFEIPVLAEELVSVLNELSDGIKQNYADGEFAKAAVTIRRNDFFFIDIYVWDETTATIPHNHNFAGAFCVPFGKTVQTEYNYQEQCQIDYGISCGTLAVLESQAIEAGDAVTIRQGDLFIHQTRHCKTPTITICVRTPRQQQNDFIYFSSGLRLLLTPTPESIITLAEQMEARLYSTGEIKRMLNNRLSQLSPVQLALIRFYYVPMFTLSSRLECLFSEVLDQFLSDRISPIQSYLRS